MIEKNTIHRFAVIQQSINVSGNMIFNCKNTHYVFDVSDNVEDVKYFIVGIELKNSMDIYHCGFNCELIYEGHAIVRAHNNLFVHLSYDNSDISYCDFIIF